MFHHAANYVFDGTRLIKNAFISVSDEGEILFISEKNGALKEQARMIFHNGIICPGFINSHCHLELSDFDNSECKNIGLTAFIKKVIRNRDRSSDISKLKIADEQMYQNGISFVGDVSNSDKSFEIKDNSKIEYHTFIELSGIDPNLSETRLKAGQALLCKLNDIKLKGSIVAHSLYSISELLFDDIIKNCRNEIQSLHFLESKEEEEWFYNRLGDLNDFLHSIQPTHEPFFRNGNELIKLLNRFKAAKSIILVHNTQLDSKFENEISNIYYCLCPKSNLYLHNNLPKSEFVMSSKEKIILGTDSHASNTELSILSEMKIMSEKYMSLHLVDLLKMATQTAASAFNIVDKYGSFTIGSKPGVLLLESIDLVNLKLKKETIIKRIF